MKKILLFAFILGFIVACKQKETPVVFVKYDETDELKKQQEHEIGRMKFKLIQSKYLDMNEVFAPFEDDLAYYSEKDYLNAAPFLIEQDMPTIQKYVSQGILSYEKIALFYLYRIRKYESNQELFLNGIIALNPDILDEARLKDRERPANTDMSLYGLPILLKDNINTEGMPTTAGAFVMQNNVETDNAFIVKQLMQNGALILGKVNLSEWAYYFCSGCPVGYSAIGGQTLNPYGRKIFETGGSSSGSGVSTAANYAVATVGTETSGSILSPSSKNSVVGLKPTIGLLSRTGIVPISSTLDTPGPMTKNVVDNAIMLQAMLGKDNSDPATQDSPDNIDLLRELTTGSLAGRRFGVMNTLLVDSIYKLTIDKLEKAGAVIVKYDPPEIRLRGFRTLLNIDMKHDLPKYIESTADKDIEFRSVADVVAINLQDTLKRAPYGQQLFEGIVKDTIPDSTFQKVKEKLMQDGKSFFELLTTQNLDAVLSINNYHAGYAAMAKYPCLTVPMGYTEEGEPISLTFIGRPFEESKLLQLGYAFEQLTKIRKAPGNYGQ